ncbi:hypothetical protein CPS_1102 [Colwellia psychrerythraea 34H]|uniref:Uncharacterized protein n=1 Tax=Colwellia psychrerythraea (strain 34H / ATCC BAA-681) TaxID=167879 RepID=Q487B9_COLP3|nr:hypothetical protein CPS_1102 [Colwellia psychrerythraea 34H]
MLFSKMNFAGNVLRYYKHFTGLGLCLSSYLNYAD